MIRNLSDDEKIGYVILGIAIGVSLGFMIKVWIDISELIQTIGVHI